MHRWLSSLVLAAAAAAVVPTALVLAQTAASTPAKPAAPAKQATPAKTSTPAKAATPAKAWTAPKTPWGDPDLQGVWNDATSTPLQRAAGKGETVAEGEANQFEEQLAYDLSRDRRDGGPEVDVNRAYNEHWMDARRLKITEDRRTSLIVDPPDGRLPPTVPISPERQKIRAERQAAGARFNQGMPLVATELSLPIRCIIRTDSPPYLPTIYNTNFRTDDGTVYQGANPETYKITERFTRVAPDTINYEFTISDPTTWTKPWTAVIPWTKIDPKEQMYEYMCHEDNFDIVHLLTGARNREKNPSLNLQPAKR
jgi:hypothetical protein